MSNVVVPVPVPNLKSVEQFIPDYKKFTAEDLRNLEKMSYEDFRAKFVKDPIVVMVQAGDVGMDLAQYGNLVAPNTFVEQNRSIVNRLMEDEAMYLNNTDLTASTLVTECMTSPHKKALMFHLLSRSWSKHSITDSSTLRNSINLPSASPVGQGGNAVTQNQNPPPIAAGVALNPGELVSTEHSIDTNNYNPFKWKHNKEDMERTAIAPGETIPPSTLGEAGGNIPMQKWGNRFVIPYELLSGGQGMRLNKLSAMVALDAATESSRQYEELLEVLEKGDGVTSLSEVEGISDYDGTAGTFSFTAYLNWLDEAMDAPFQISHVIMLKEQQRDMRATLAALAGTQAFDQLSRVGLAPSSMTNMEGQGKVRYGRAPSGSITASHILGIDARFAVERVNRAGMTIRQQAQHIANQTEEVVVSDTYLLARLAHEAVKVLNVAS